MATFETQVEALTGISIDGSSDPTQTELTGFLVDGVKEVVNKIIETRPYELSKFTATTASGSGVSVVKTGQILSVVREHDSTTIFRKCTPIDPSDRYNATDSDSLLYRSKINPGYYELDGSIYTVPAAAQSGDNELHVTQVSYDAGVTYGDTIGSGIDNFPADYEHLVALYAAIKALEAKMGAITNGMSTFLVTAVPPDLPSTAADAPTYEISTTNVPSANSGENIDGEIAQLQDYIEVSEDIELAAAKTSEIQIRLKRALDKFNSDIAEYKVENDAEIGHYSAEINAYQVEVNAEVNEQTAKIQTETAKYQWFKDRHNSLLAQFMNNFATPTKSETS